jgi:ComF family protein
MTPLSEFICSRCGKRSHEIFATCHPQAIPVFAEFFYADNPIRNAIYALKYDGVEYAANSFAHLLWCGIQKQFPFKQADITPEIVFIPIPLAQKREQERGFNQAELLSKKLSALIAKSGHHVHVAPNFLERIKNTESQTIHHSYEKRRENIKGAFRVTKKETLRKNTIVFLVDDVSTSGATLEEAAQMLRKEGVPHIAGLVIAKA